MIRPTPVPPKPNYEQRLRGLVMRRNLSCFCLIKDLLGINFNRTGDIYRTYAEWVRPGMRKAQIDWQWEQRDKQIKKRNKQRLSVWRKRVGLTK